MDNNGQMFELLTKMYAEMQRGFKNVDERFEQVDQRFEQVDQRFEQVDQRFEQTDGKFRGINQRLDTLEKTVLRIENDHGEKLQALFDGQTQIIDRLDRIENEVTRHDEFLLRRIK